MSFFLVRSLIPIASIPAIQLISYTSVFSKERAGGAPLVPGLSVWRCQNRLGLAGFHLDSAIGALFSRDENDLQMKYSSVSILPSGFRQ
jgi:hypothetical protein